jgi:glycine/D-amino acid oxidase-like deaminating enzyme
MGATRKRSLRSGHSIWQRRALLRFPERRLSRDTRCDVLVIVAGITGAMAAEQLTDAGLSVVVLDRRGAVRGSTLASTALLQYEIDTPLAKLADRISRTRAERIWRRSRLALDALRDRTRRLGIAADCVDKSSLYLEGNVLDAASLRVEATARRRAGFEVRLLLRVGPDGRIICGGEDETFSDAAKRDALSAEKIAAIEGKLAKLLHVDARADYGWCGNFGTSSTGTTDGARPPPAICSIQLDPRRLCRRGPELAVFG